MKKGNPEKPKNRNHAGVSKSELRKYGNDRMNFILSMFQAVLADFVNVNSSYRRGDSAKDYATIERRLRSEGLGFISKTLPSMMESLYIYLECGYSSYPGFKLQPGAEYPVLLNRLFRDVYAHDDGSGPAFGQIYQICSLFKKLKGPFLQTVYRKELRSFAETDQEIGSIDFTKEPLVPIIDNARQLINKLFEIRTKGEPNQRLMLPRPGPGATNTPVDKHMRYQPHVLYTDLDEEFGYFEFYYRHSLDFVNGAGRYLYLPKRDIPKSRFKFVHKYLGKPRGICIEENEMQFFQQALKKYMCERLERHPLTRGKINFTSQSINQILAMESSKDRLLATVDMSAASDRVARELVFRLFWDTWLGDMLDVVSTRVVETPEGDDIWTHKFAPMGSGVCFPTMAVVHWALITSIIQLSSVPHANEVAKSVYVYGDDIVLPSQAIQAIYDYLPLFGMKLNTTKSFHASHFRESCGVHAYNGVDVTPVYVNHALQTTQSKSDVTTLLSLIAKESQFYCKGFHETSRCIQSLVHKHFWLLPTTGRDSPVLGWKRDGRSDLSGLIDAARRTRDNDALQTFELELQTVVPRYKGRPGVFTQDDSYLRYLLTGAKSDGSISLSDKKSDGTFKVPFASATVPGAVEDLTVRRRWINETDL